ncbi:hypothetical protein CEW46_21440 [Bacillus cereus]|nr:hypothetical protein CEW46_21440 [Bacillus cereus]
MNKKLFVAFAVQESRNGSYDLREFDNDIMEVSDLITYINSHVDNFDPENISEMIPWISHYLTHTHSPYNTYTVINFQFLDK